MTYWIVITMIFVAILAVALATGLAPDSDASDVTDDVATSEKRATTHDDV